MRSLLLLHAEELPHSGPPPSEGVVDVPREKGIHVRQFFLIVCVVLEYLLGEVLLLVL